MNKYLISAALGAVLALGGASAASAQQRAAASSAPVVAGIGWANIEAAEAATTAFKTAESQRPVTYKAQIDAANARKTQIEAQLQPLATKLQTDARAANPNQAALQQQYAQIQQIEQSGQNEINNLLQPVALSRAYVVEQIGDKLEQATKQAMAKQRIDILLDSGSVINAPEAYNLNQAILNELNTILPSAQLVPPNGWLPRAQRDQQAAAQQQAPAATPATTAKPSGR